MSHRGYIALWRKSLDSGVFQDEGLWKLWCLCLMKANHKECWLPIEGMVEPVKLLPGQFIIGRFSLHKEFYKRKRKRQKTPLTLWRWMQTLEKLGNLDIKTNNKYSMISIVNWDSYQNNGNQNEQQNEQQANNKRTTGEQQVITDNNDKNVKNVKNDNKKDIVEQEAQLNIPYQEIIEYLNQKARKHFKHTSKETQNFIKARWNQGFRLDAFKFVIDIKCKKWLTEPKMLDYLRPQTLFGTKFESYLNETKHPLQGKVSDKTIQSIEALNEWEQKENEKQG